ncbi:MAG TPA: ABC transporter permease [Vicinamibacterales bacterium]|nr:ABC transporter permease [Vicinamibacterales bacterium]
MTRAAAIRVDGIRKAYGRTVAVGDVSFDVQPAEIQCLAEHRMRAIDPRVISADLPILTSMLIAVSAVLSLVAIMAIYREGGILKRLRATPLRPFTILTAHVLVKMAHTAVTVALMVFAGRSYYPVDARVPLASRSLRCPRCFASAHACYRSPMRCRCFAASGKARGGPGTRATSPFSW